MRWRIRGIHAPSGAWRSAIVDASGKAEAEALGAAAGLTNIEASVERSKWFKLWALLYLVAMFGAGLLHAYYRGDRNSPRDLGAIVGAHVFGAAILLAVSALIKARGGKLLILIAVPAFVMGLSAGMKKPMPKSANARDVLADLSDMKETGARLPEVREGTKASGLEPFISLTGRMMERMAAQTVDYEKKGRRKIFWTPCSRRTWWIRPGARHRGRPSGEWISCGSSTRRRCWGSWMIF